MAYHRNTKDYSDDWDAFKAGLKAKSTLDLTYYARNLVSAASRIEGDDDFANALFEKLTTRARLCNEELSRRGSYNAPKTTPEERKRRLAELNSGLQAHEGATETLPVARSVVPMPMPGARFNDPPIPTRPTPLLQLSPAAAPALQPFSLSTDERLSDDEDTQPLTPPVKKVRFEEDK